MRQTQLKSLTIWAGVTAALTLPLALSLNSPLLQWRDPAYVAAGIAGTAAMALMLLQPLLAAGLLPGVDHGRARRLHRWLGGAIIIGILAHVGGLWITSPPDVIDALTFTSPTPFSDWGVIAMWALFAAALLGATRRAFRARLLLWRRLHTALVALASVTTVVHVLLIEGTMEPFSKVLLAAALVIATLTGILSLRTWSLRSRSRRRRS